jgi:Trypsin-like peptidase domain
MSHAPWQDRPSAKPRARVAPRRASWRRPGESDSLFVVFVRSCLVLAIVLGRDSGPERVPTRKPAASAAVKQKRPERRERLVTAGELRDMPEDTRLLSLAGRVDVSNRYLSSVLVTADLDDEQRGICSGAILAPRLVLTAGHCVCPERRVPSKPGADPSDIQFVIDGSGCAKTAQATTSVYEPRSAVGNDIYSFRNSHVGMVLPHPELRVLLDAHEEVVSSTADLALIVLDEPLDKKFPPLPLADQDVQLNESLLILGSGHDELTRIYDGERHISRNKVTEVPDSGGGRLRIEQPGGHHYRGDSGGPCLREGLEGMTLVGIAARNLGQGEAVTSTYPYRDWLRAELQRVKDLPLPARAEPTR